MDNYANKNLNLSDFRGMNIQEFAHSSDEAARIINFKPTGAGLEMRNGARTLMAGKQISGKIVGESNRAMLTTDGYIVQKVTAEDGTVTLVNTGYRPFGALDNAFETPFADVLVSSSSKELSQELDKSVYVSEVFNSKSYVACSKDGKVIVIGDVQGDYTGNPMVHVWVDLDGTGVYEFAMNINRENYTTGNFGWAVAINADGSRIFIGDPLDDVPYGNQGSVCVFERTDDYAWEYSTKILDTSPDANKYFGAILHCSDDGNSLVIGSSISFAYSSFCGNLACVWIYSSDSWSESLRVVGSTSVGNNLYLLGSNVSISGDGLSVYLCGANYIHRYDYNGSWSNTSVITAKGQIFSSNSDLSLFCSKNGTDYSSPVNVYENGVLIQTIIDPYSGSTTRDIAEQISMSADGKYIFYASYFEGSSPYHGEGYIFKRKSSGQYELYKTYTSDNGTRFPFHGCFSATGDVYVLNGVVYNNNAIQHSDVITLDENMVVLFDNEPIETNGADQSMALWTYNWNLKSILGCGMGIGSTTIEEIDRYLLDDPISISSANGLFVASGTKVYKINQDKYLRSIEKKQLVYSSLTNATLFDAIDETGIVWYDSTGSIKYYNGTSVFSLTIANVEKILLVNKYGKTNGLIVAKVGDNLEFISISNSALSLDYEIETLGIIDFCAMRTANSFDGEIDFISGYNPYYVYVVENYSVACYSTDGSTSHERMLLSNLKTGHGFDKIACPKMLLAGRTNTADTFQKQYGYFVLYNDTEIQKVNFEFIDGEFVNVELAEKLNSTAFPFVTGGIKDICIQTNPYMIPLNYHNTVGVRPYFGDSEVSGGTFVPTFNDPDLVTAKYKGTGKLTWSASGTTITGKAGTSTVFTSEARVGDFIMAVISAGTYETRQIVSITDDDTLVVDIAFSGIDETTGVDFYVYPSNDLYTQPRLGDEYAIPVAIDDGVKFNTNVPNGTSPTVWQYWLFYVIPSPTLDASVESLRLLRGLYNDSGFYQVTAYGEEPVESATVGKYVDKLFPNAWGVDSVVSFEVGYGSTVFNIKDNFEDEFGIFKGKAAGSMSCTITTITAGEASGSEDSLNIMSAYFSGSGTTPDVGVINKFSFSLEEGEDYWLSVTLATDHSAQIAGHLYVYNGKTTSLTKSITIPKIADGFTTFNYKFRCMKSGKHTFRIDTDLTGATPYTLYAGDISLSVYSPFSKQVDISWKEYNDEKFVVQDFKFGETWHAFLDKEARALYFSDKGLCYANKGQAIAFAKAPIVCGFNTLGAFVVTQNETRLIGGYTFDVATNTKVLDYGLPDDNYFGFDVSLFGAVVFNEEGLFYLNEDTYLDNVASNLSERIVTWLPLDADDTNLRQVCFDPINQTIVAVAKNRLDGSITVDTAVFATYFAIYDLNEKSWHIYTYNAAEPSEGYCQFLKTVNRVAVNMGATTTPATTASVRIMEESNDYAREVMEFQNEAWDLMIGNFLTRSMSFDYTGYVKRLSMIQCENSTMRPFDDVAQFDFVHGAFYERYSPYSSDADQRIVEEFGTYEFDVMYPNHDNALMLSLSEQMNCPFMWGAMDMWYGRLQDSENPKLILVSEILTVEYSNRKPRGGY